MEINMKTKKLYSEIRLYNVIENGITKSECVEFIYRSSITGLANVLVNQEFNDRSKLHDGKIAYMPTNIHDFFKALLSTDLTVDETERKPNVYLCGKASPITIDSKEYESSYSKYFRITFADLANYLISHYEVHNDEIYEFYDTFKDICAPAIKQSSKVEITL